MNRLKWFVCVLFCFVSVAVQAQNYDMYRYGSTGSYVDEPATMAEIDETLFRMPIDHSIDAYLDATRYYRVQGAMRRRGLYYTLAEHIISPEYKYVKDLIQPLLKSSITLYGAQSNYRFGLRAYHAQMLDSGWSLSMSTWAQTGRDMFIEGVFRNTIAPEITLNKRLENNDFLIIKANVYYSMKGMQYGSTPEVFDLVGSKYYNPSWGFYNGKVRNSKVRRDIAPEVSVHYQKDVNDRTTFVLESNIGYSRRANSSLGWYNATTPQADYYRKLPSFMPEGEIKDYVTDIWRGGDSDYTQMNWDEMVRLNSISSNGVAHYTLEDRVERGVAASAAAVATTNLLPNLNIVYGVEYKYNDSRYFKQMRDLLGADYLVDYDIFIGDSYNKTVPLDNNLLNPDNRVVEGDRFGYDYSLRKSSIDAIFRFNYRAKQLDFKVDGEFGNDNFYRIGHYEKERFASFLSLGESSSVKCAPYKVKASVGYAHGANKYYALRYVSSRLSPYSRNLFLNDQYANYLSRSLKGESINSIALSCNFNHPWIYLHAELFAIYSRGGSSIYSLYDDLTSTMCRASITDIGYSSIGIEAVADLYLHKDFKVTTTLLAGRYRYDSDPNVELFADYDLQSISSPTRSHMDGINIGNAPQIASTISFTYFGVSRWILSLSSSYSGLRYAQPSIPRRSDKLLSQAFMNDNDAQAAMKQIRLDDIFDAEISASRFFWFEDGSRLSLRAVVRNLFAGADRVVYARESDRIILQRVDDYFVGADMREGVFQYGLPRNVQLSISYQF